MMNLNSDLPELCAQHQILEKELENVMAHPASTDEEIAEIKRKKLKLKDEIVRLQRVAQAA